MDNASHLLMCLQTSTISGDVHSNTDLWNKQLDRYAFHRATHAASTRTNRCLRRFSRMIQRTSGSSLENHFGGPILVFRSPPVYRSLLDCGLNVSPPDPPHRARAEEGIADHTEPTSLPAGVLAGGRLFMFLNAAGGRYPSCRLGRFLSCLTA